MFGQILSEMRVDTNLVLVLLLRLVRLGMSFLPRHDDC
jgi:hypothetical protein